MSDRFTPLDDAALNRLFREARTYSHWLPRPVDPALLRRLAELMRFGPTSANASPARIVFVVSRETKEKLRPYLSEGNVRQTMEAPVTTIIGQDLRFYEKLGYLYPHQPEARSWFEGKPDAIQATAFRNASLQAGYLILAARALGLDCGPMSGFDKAGVEAAFLSEGVEANMLCNLGYGDPARLHPRSPRLAFDEFCSIV
ncbi:MAG TPA: malonic semialdehyde reductase [Beijerinckiaceae bacterium]